MPFALPPLPYAPDALAPHMSADTLEHHHGKHHKSYVEKANTLIDEAGWNELSPVEVVRRAKAEGMTKLFDQSAQAWNHEFYWQCLSPTGGGAPGEGLKAAIDRDLGGMESFAADFAKQATEHFGSGWAWLVRDGSTLKVVTTHDAEAAFVQDVTPLLVLDVWEHAYYLDYQQARPDFVAAYLKHLVNWEFAAANYGR